MEMLRDVITGIRVRINELNDNKDLFIKAQGLEEEVAKIQLKTVQNETALVTLKDEHRALQQQKNDIVRTSTGKLSEAMTAVLPDGEAVIDIDNNGKVFIGWKKEGDSSPRPYHGLSEGEKKTFNPALIRALKGNINIIEAAEVDRKRLENLLEKYRQDETQTIAATCHDYGQYEGWKEVRL